MMKRYRVDFGYGRYYFEPKEDGDWVQYAEVEQLLKRQASAAIAGMNAAKAISSAQVEQAHRLKAESSPEALESERAANDLLTAEVEQLQEFLRRFMNCRTEPPSTGWKVAAGANSGDALNKVYLDVKKHFASPSANSGGESP